MQALLVITPLHKQVISCLLSRNDVLTNTGWSCHVFKLLSESRDKGLIRNYFQEESQHFLKYQPLLWKQRLLCSSSLRGWFQSCEERKAAAQRSTGSRRTQHLNPCSFVQLLPQAETETTDMELRRRSVPQRQVWFCLIRSSVLG